MPRKDPPLQGSPPLTGLGAGLRLAKQSSTHRAGPHAARTSRDHDPETGTSGDGPGPRRCGRRFVRKDGRPRRFGVFILLSSLLVFFSHPAGTLDCRTGCCIGIAHLFGKGTTSIGSTELEQFSLQSLRGGPKNADHSAPRCVFGRRAKGTTTRSPRCASTAAVPSPPTSSWPRPTPSPSRRAKGREGVWVGVEGRIRGSFPRRD